MYNVQIGDVHSPLLFSFKEALVPGIIQVVFRLLRRNGKIHHQGFSAKDIIIIKDLHRNVGQVPPHL